MNKIGIITYHRHRNYGSYAQSYCLAKAVKELGFEPEIIDYWTNATLKEQRKSYLKFPTGILRLYKELKFIQYRSKLPLSKRKFHTHEELKKHANEYKTIITGSDEIWREDVENDLAFFLNYTASDVKKIAYAVSCGQTSKYSDQKCQDVEPLLKEFQHIAVRDDNTKRIIEKLMDNKIEFVLDPTFLVKFSDIYDRPPSKEPYILIYGRISDSRRLNFIQKLKEKTGLPLISIGHYIKCADRNKIFCSPGEWAAAFKYARYVVTDYYHGTLLSIQNRCHFFTLSNPSKINKVGDILGKLGLEHRWIRNFDDLDSNTFNNLYIDYTSKEELIKSYTEASMNFLRKALSNDK